MKLSLRNEPSPFLRADIFSKLFFCWIGPLLTKGFKTPLVEGDLYNLIPEEEAKFLTDQLENEWQKELLKLKKNQKPSLLLAITRIWYLKLIINGLLMALEETIRILMPIVVVQLLGYFNNEIDLKTALMYGSFLATGIFFAGIVHHQAFNNAYLYGMRLRISCSGLVYRESFRLRSSSLNSEDGLLVNLLSTDAARLESFFLFLPYFFIAPLEAIFVIYTMITQIGYSFLTGIIILIIFTPLQSILGKLYAYAKTKQTKYTDKRINAITEFLNAIKIVKMYCWEEPYERLIKKIRKNEIKYQYCVNSVIAVNALLENDMCCVITYLSIGVLVSFTQTQLKTAYVVFAVGFFTKLCGVFGYYFSKSIICTIAGIITLNRYEAFMLKPKFVKTNENEISSEEITCVDVENLSVKFSEQEGPVLDDITVKVNTGEMLALAGPVGCGKSVFLKSILNELSCQTGQVQVAGSVFYVSQEPWLFPATVKENILFGRVYDREKFNNVVKACFLGQDLNGLTQGENTLIGDRGVNLSGGQRARICLARALYSDSQIYLLDDPLSAVDANVAKHLFERCINGYLKSKTRIFVTHNVQHLIKADRILILDKGKVLFQGTFNEISSLNLNLENLLSASIDFDKENRIKTESANKIPEVARHLKKTVSSSSSYLTSLQSAIELNSSRFLSRRASSLPAIDDCDEARLKGSIGWNIFLDYFKSGGGYVGALVVIILFVAAQGFIVFSDYFASTWANFEQTYHLNQKNASGLFNTTTFGNSSLNPFQVPSSIRSEKLKNYSYLILVSISLALTRSFIFYSFQIRSSVRYHSHLLKSIITTHLRFFDLNPLGRIMNRFSKDIGVVDEHLPQVLFEFLQLGTIMVGVLVFSLMINFWIITAILPLFFLSVYVRKYFLATLNELKRLEGIYRSPLFIQVNNTLTGMLTIRACRNIDIFQLNFENKLDNYTKVCNSSIHVQRWFQSRLDLICSVFATTAIFCSILGKTYFDSTSGQIGLLLSYVLNLTSYFQWLLVQNCEISSLLTSVERIIEYQSLKKEPLNEKKLTPDKGWPNSGEILFYDVSFSYAKNLPPVLKGITFEIRPGEKIGVVGRTGAGKSSLVMSLFRLAETSGDIYIDGIDIKNLSLKDLRKRLSIIPQEPVLFSGTIRTNLDPYSEYSDLELWAALDQVQLKDKVNSLKGGLEAEIEQSGKNLSFGQRQLICLARAIVKKAPILIMDEATANVDRQTDQFVQKALRECFSESTVIAIAHRVETVIGYDRIMCLNNGKLESFGSPYDLVTETSTVLWHLVHSLGKNEAEKLTELARVAKQASSERARLKSGTPDDEDANFRPDVDLDVEEKEAFLRKNFSS